MTEKTNLQQTINVDLCFHVKFEVSSLLRQNARENQKPLSFSA